MFKVKNYLEDARKHEQVFRNILKTLPEDFRKGKNLDADSPLEEIFNKFSTGNRYGIWTILDFKVGPLNDPLVKLLEGEALFANEDIAFMSGSGRISKYKVGNDNSVKYDSDILNWMS